MLSLLGTLLGFLTSALPDFMELLQDRRDKKHELNMMTKQAEINKDKEVSLARIEAESDALSGARDYDIELLGAVNEQSKTLNERFKATGDQWLDRLRGAVRPIVTYWWMVLYSGVKAAMVWYVFTTPGLDFMEAIKMVWSEDDTAIFASIIAFWFGHKMMMKKREQAAQLAQSATGGAPHGIADK